MSLTCANPRKSSVGARRSGVALLSLRLCLGHGLQHRPGEHTISKLNPTTAAKSSNGETLSNSDDAINALALPANGGRYSMPMTENHAVGNGHSHHIVVGNAISETHARPSGPTDVTLNLRAGPDAGHAGLRARRRVAGAHEVPLR
jgi:hypothetical protein